MVKTAIAGEDPNWGRIIMAIGKAGVVLNFDKLSIRFGKISIIQSGKLNTTYDENQVSEYMQNDTIEIDVDICKGSKNFTAYTMDLTKKYIEIIFSLFSSNSINLPSLVNSFDPKFLFIFFGVSFV